MAGDSAALFSTREHFYTRWPLSVHAFIAQITVCTIESTQYSTLAAQEHPTATGPWRGCHRASPAARNQPRRLTRSPPLMHGSAAVHLTAPLPLHHRVLRRGLPSAAHRFDGRGAELEAAPLLPGAALRAAPEPVLGLVHVRLRARRSASTRRSQLGSNAHQRALDEPARCAILAPSGRIRRLKALPPEAAEVVGEALFVRLGLGRRTMRQRVTVKLQGATIVPRCATLAERRE